MYFLQSLKELKKAFNDSRKLDGHTALGTSHWKCRDNQKEIIAHCTELAPDVRHPQSFAMNPENLRSFIVDMEFRVLRTDIMSQKCIKADANVITDQIQKEQNAASEQMLHWDCKHLAWKLCLRLQVVVVVHLMLAICVCWKRKLRT